MQESSARLSTPAAFTPVVAKHTNRGSTSTLGGRCGLLWGRCSYAFAGSIGGKLLSRALMRIVFFFSLSSVRLPGKLKNDDREKRIDAQGKSRMLGGCITTKICRDSLKQQERRA